MNLQRTLLRAMLWMLGLAAGAGVLAVFASTAVMGRVAGTVLVAAVAVGLAIPAARWIDDPKRRAGGLTGLGAIVVAFTLALAAIWADLFYPGFSSGGEVQWRLAVSALLAAIGGLACASLIAGREAGSHWWARTVGLYAALIGIILLAGAIWTDWPSSGPLNQTGWLVLASGAAAALSLVGLGLEARPWRWLGVLAAAVGLVIGLVGVWWAPSSDPTAYIASMCVAAAVAYAVVVLSVPLGESRSWACLVSIGSVAATGACVSLLSLITGGFDASGPPMLVRLTGAMGIVAACATLGIVILYRLHRRPATAGAPVADIRQVQLVCPHCGRKHGAPPGDSACAGCGLLFTLAVTEPRCPKCDYPLLNLKGDVCPECGARRPGAALSRA